MRINPSSDDNKQPEPQQNSRAAMARHATQRGDSSESINASQTGNQSFASILNRAAKPKDKERDKDFKENDGTRESKEANSHEDSESIDDVVQSLSEETKETRKDKNGGDSGGGFGQLSGGVRENFIGSADAVSARAILHIADLERIVSTIRTKIQAGQQTEVLIELKNSVLEGLKIRLSANGENNRVSAEFIAASEKVKTQLDSRLTDLSDLLRSRGVALAELKTSLGSGQFNDANSNSSNNGNSNAALRNERLNRVGTQSDTAQQVPVDEDNMGLTYRA